MAENHAHARSVAIGVWVKLGSSYESREENGASHFIEHMVFKGTKRRRADEIATVLEARGGDLNAFTDREYTCFHATVLQEDVELAIDVLSDLVSEPLFDKKQFDREKRVLLQELAMIEDSPDEWAFDVFAGMIWRGEPLGQPVIGTRKTIGKMKVGKLEQFFQDHYGPENMVVSVAGAIDFEALKALVGKSFSGTGEKQKVIPSKRLPSRYRATRKCEQADIEQQHVLLGYQGVELTHPSRYDAVVLSVYLGGGMGSRLFQEVRENAALAYSVDAELLPYSDSGVLVIYAGMESKSVRKYLEIVAAEIEKVKLNEIPIEHLDRVKGQIRGSILLASELMDSRQESLGRNELVFGRYVSIEEIIKAIEMVDPVRVKKVANQIFQRKAESILCLGRSRLKPKQLEVL